MSSPLTHPCPGPKTHGCRVKKDDIYICKEGVVFALLQPLAHPFSHLEGSQRASSAQPSRLLSIGLSSYLSPSSFLALAPLWLSPTQPRLV